MSFFEDASIVLIPSGIKNQKIYSVKPTDGTGDLTFSRASSATRVQSDGLIEKVRSNVLTYSQDFSNANWVGFDVSRTGTQTDPNGGTTASLYTSLTNSANVSANFSTASASPYTLSIYIRGASSGVVSLRVDSGSTAAQNDISYTTSWQRFTYTFTAGSSTSTVVLGGYASFTTGEGIYVAFAQAELGDIATDYIATTTAAVSVGPVSGLPRLDYLGSTCPRLILEPQRSNLNLYSEAFGTASYWFANNSTITSNNAVSPDGYTNADMYTAAGAGNYINASATSTGSNTITFSVFAKAGTSSQFRIREAFYFGSGTVFNLATGAIISGTGTITNYGNGWYRCTQTQVYGVGEVSLSWSYDLNGAASGTVYLYGAQAEVGAYATSYIPTLGTSVTRVADAAGKTSISSIIGQTEGTIFLDIVDAKRGAGDLWIAQSVVNDGSTGILIYADSSSSIAVFINGTSNFFLNASVNIEQPMKIAVGYKTGSYALAVNGAIVATSSNAMAPPSGMNQFAFVKWQGGSNGEKQSVKQALLFKTRLTNAQLAELTA